MGKTVLAGPGGGWLSSDLNVKDPAGETIAGAGHRLMVLVLAQEY
jgi:hypothetical protein